MKKLLLILIALPMIGFGQFTYVPDDNFEQALINLGYDTFLDDNVTTASIDTVTYLNIDNQGIADLTGIADFTSLATLSCNNNQLSSLVVLNPSLLNLSCTNNQMLNLDVSNNGVNGSLVSVDCSFNQLTSLLIINNINLNYLNCSNNLLTTLAFGNTTLFDLNCSYNLFTELDVSSCNALVSLNCSNNDLNTLDVRNGNNVNITNANFNSTLNSNLNCIDVDNPPYSIANWLNIDAWSSFSINCPPVVFGCTDSLSCNYDPFATIDDGSCFYSYSGIYVNLGPGCDSLIVGNMVFYSLGAGVYADTIPISNGCDSIVIYTFDINQSTSSYDTLSVTTSVYTWNSITITTSGDYSDTLINTAGCDSIAYLNLTITNTTGLLDVTNTEKTLLKITDMLGQETPYRRNTPLFYIYDDGTVEKRIVIE